MKRALISVSNKEGIISFAQALTQLGIEIISTGGTKKALDDAGVVTISIDEVTHFPEMLDGRVKTLHPAIHGGLLAKRDNDEHMTTIQQHHIQPIDFVVVNLYPFKETVLNTMATHDDIVENIDIGGPSMLRSAAKNYNSVTVITDPNDYAVVLEELKVNGSTTQQTREKLAAKVFRHTASYDALIARYFTNRVEEEYPEQLTVTFDRKQVLRYGENAHQTAAFYENVLPSDCSIARAVQLHGKELSYNNIKDADAAVKIAMEFDEPVAVAVKHMNPCGVGVGETIVEAFERCYQADSVSIFGGIVVLNREVTETLAQQLHPIFLEIVIAPSFTQEALTILMQKKNIRLMTLSFDHKQTNDKEIVSVLGGLLVQDIDSNTSDSNSDNWETMTTRQPTDYEKRALAFAWKVVKHVKSNAIVIANDKQTLGIGAGQMNRVGAAKIALEQAKQAVGHLTDAVMGSDAFFPMNDTVNLAGEYGISAIIQPGGSIKDEESVIAANAHQMTMVKTNTRHFKH